MATRIFYLRNRNNVVQKRDGSFTRGTPVAVVASEVNPNTNTISYTFSAVHPRDVFIKQRAVHIAVERLHGFDKNKKSKAVRRNGARVIRISAEHLNGHEITKLIMRDLFASLDVPEKVRDLAGEWLSWGNVPKDRLPTTPVPSEITYVNRETITPPRITAIEFRSAKREAVRKNSS